MRLLGPEHLEMLKRVPHHELPGAQRPRWIFHYDHPYKLEMNHSYLRYYGFIAKAGAKGWGHWSWYGKEFWAPVWTPERGWYHAEQGAPHNALDTYFHDKREDEWL